MTWAKIDDKLTDHPKVVAAGNEGVGAWVRMIAYAAAHMTDGRIPRLVARRIASSPKLLARLVEVRLLDVLDDGDYAVHDFLEWNPDSDALKSKRDAEREKKARQREEKRKGHVPGGQAGGQRDMSRGDRRGDNGTCPGGTGGGTTGHVPGGQAGGWRAAGGARPARPGARVPSRPVHEEDHQPPTLAQDRKGAPTGDAEPAGILTSSVGPETQSETRLRPVPAADLSAEAEEFERRRTDQRERLAALAASDPSFAAVSK